MPKLTYENRIINVNYLGGHIRREIVELRDRLMVDLLDKLQSEYPDKKDPNFWHDYLIEKRLIHVNTYKYVIECFLNSDELPNADGLFDVLRKKLKTFAGEVAIRK